MKKTNNIFYIVIFFVILVCTSLFSVAHSTIRFSDMENRSLKAIPAFSLKSVLDGSFQRDMETGMKDQSLIKNTAVKIAVFFNMVTGKQDKNGTYFCSDGTYVKMETSNDYTRSHLDMNTRIIKKFADETKKSVDICLIPPKGSAEPYKLPAYAPYIDDAKIRKDIWRQIRGNENLNLVSLETFFDGDEGKYFYTDHHYNSYGAYLAAKSYQQSRGLDLQDIDFFAPATVGDNFRGTLYRKAPMYIAKTDRLTIPSSLPPVSVSYYYGSDGRLGNSNMTSSLYEPKYMFTEDKYNVYQGGNHGMTVIVNDDMSDGPVLMMVKDSFANSAVPYLIGSYRKIIMIDLRYYGGASLQQEIKDQDPDRIVVWYETLDYATESRFAQLLR